MLLYQIAIVCFVVAAVFFLLRLELEEKTAKALKPFKEAADIAEKKEKIEAVDLPKPDKKTAKADKPQAPKKSPIRGQTADFRAALWGTSRSRIIAEEKAKLLNDESAYDLDFLDTINNLETVIKYTFSSSRLESGHYIFFGDKCLNLEQIDQNTIPKIGAGTDKEIQNRFALLPAPRNKILSDLPCIEMFYSEILSSLVEQLGQPVENSLGELEKKLTPHQKVASVVIFNRSISYSWDTPKTIVDVIFAAHQNVMYLCISYHNRKTAK